MTFHPWIWTGLLTLSIVLTLFTNWLVSGRQRPSIPRRFASSEVVAVAASVLWIILLLLAGIVASRYIERVEHTALGWVCFGLLAGVLSWIRAVLYRRLQKQAGHRPAAQGSQGLTTLGQMANYLLFALVVYLFGAWVLRRTVDPVAFIPLILGALIPDLDSPSSPIGRLLPAISRWLRARFGQRQGWHSLAANGLVAVVTLPLLLVPGTQVWVPLFLGFLCHILLDLFTPQGAMLFWPLNHTLYSLVGKSVPTRDPSRSRKLLAALGILAILLLFAVELGPPPPAPAPSLSYEQTLQRYYSLRGTSLVYAYVEGSWQVSGRRTSGTFEILNAVGDSFIMLDRYTGTVFSAGQGADDNLYVSRIRLQTGSPARIKPVELHLQGQHLADGLPVLYEMQKEPGLQHIYVSGDIVLASTEDGDVLALQQDYSQTSLRQVQAYEPGHFGLRYLTASDLIALAGLSVETADLVVVATYATPASGPTVTPLPTASVTAQPAQ